MERPPPQLDLGEFRLLTDAEFNALPFSARLEYLKTAVEARRIINAQITETLFGLGDEKPSSN